jgi:hypothetical protein
MAVGRLIDEKTVRAEVELGHGVTLRDLVFIGGWFVAMTFFNIFIDSRLTILFYIVNIILPFILTRQSQASPGRALWQRALLILMRDKNIYHMKRGERRRYE